MLCRVQVLRVLLFITDSNKGEQQTISLGFLPLLLTYQLYVEYSCTCRRDVLILLLDTSAAVTTGQASASGMFLLSGLDKKVHVYKKEVHLSNDMRRCNTNSYIHTVFR